MRSPLVLCATLTAAACAGPGASPDERLYDNYSATVTGIILLPESAAGDTTCARVDVYATADDGKGGAPVRVGKPDVHQGHGRCYYEITNLPDGVTLGVHVEAPERTICGDGQGVALAFAPEGQETFSLRDHQDRTQDFRAQCNPGTSSR